MKQLSAIAAVMVLTQWSGAAESNARPVTLDSCIQAALQKNLDIRLSRYLPELTETELWTAYSAYDPTFNFSATRRIEQDPGGTRFGGFVAPPVDQENDQFGTSLTGLTPIGGRYTLSGNTTRFNSEDTLRIGTNLFGPFGTVDYAGAATASMSQPLLRNSWIDSARWTIQLTKRALKQDQESVRLQVINTVTDVQRAYYSLFAAREAVRVQEKALELAERSLSESRKKVEVGALAPLEEKRAEARVAAVRVDLIGARQNLQSASNNLKRLITDDYGAMEDALDAADALTPVPFPFNRQDSWHLAMTSRPDLIQQQLTLEQQNITLRFRRNQLFPQLDLSASYSAAGRASQFAGNLDGIPDTEIGDYFRSIRDRDNPTHSYGVVFSIPLSNRAERGRYKAAKLTKEQMLLQLKRLEQSILVSVDNAILTAQTAYERIQATREAKLFAEQALDAEQKKLENGKSTYFEVLNLQSQLISASANAVSAVADYHQAIAELHRAEGSTLDKAGLKLEFR